MIEEGSAVKMLSDTLAHDFSNATPNYAQTYSGSDRKQGILWNSIPCLVKFPSKHAKRTDMSTSYVNNIFGEYIGSHIAQSIGLPAQDTFLGYYHDEPCVVCVDFKKQGENLIEFQDFLKMRYNSDERKRHVNLKQLYDTIADPRLPLAAIQKAAIDQYWEIFVIDAFLGNFDRHAGNWGYIHKDGRLTPSPTYDYGSTLFPQLSDFGREEKLNDPQAILERVFVFPSSQLVLSSEKTGRVGYYDMLCSGLIPSLSKAIRKVAKNIDMQKINCIIDQTPMATDMQKDFYKTILKCRKQLIIDKALDLAMAGQYDENAKNRIETGQSITSAEVRKLLLECGNDLSCAIGACVAEEIFVFPKGEKSPLPEIQQNIQDIRKTIPDPGMGL